jgi:hypothetical protein
MDIPIHPLFTRLDSASATTFTTLRGYVGPSLTKECIRLYKSLDGPSESVEIPQADIIHFAEMPEFILPYGGMIVWIKKDAEVAVYRGATVAGVKADRELAEVNQGRLQIRVRRGLVSDDCQSTCAVCQSRCCVSRCRAEFKGVLTEGLLSQGSSSKDV